MCRSTDGQTIGYKYFDDKIVPVFEDVNPDFLLKWGYNSYLKGIKDFAHYETEFCIKNDLKADSYLLYREYFDYFFKSLDKKTAKIFGAIPFAKIGSERSVVFCAKKYNVLGFLFLLSSGRQPYSVLPNVSKALSSDMFKLLSIFMKKYGSLRKFLLNVYFHKRDKKAYVRILGIKISLSRLIWRKNNF